MMRAWVVGGLPEGPCGKEFKESFSCFHYSESEPKGSECIDQFVAMQVHNQKLSHAHNQMGVAQSSVQVQLSSSRHMYRYMFKMYYINRNVLKTILNYTANMMQ